jgi:hypothetical protein
MDAGGPFADDSPWRGEARALLERAIARHGGWAAWLGAGGVSLRLVHLSGLVPALKGPRRGGIFALPARATVWPRRAEAVFHDYPAAGGRGVFAAGKTRLEDAAGARFDGRDDPRATFRGLRKLRRWSALDALYFFGYALTHYHSLPFSLVAARPLRLASARVAGRRLRGVDVELPAGLHTHCRRQSFYFDDDGRLVRHDYVAEIVGAFARGAHHWSDYVDVGGGLLVARRRHVIARLGRRELPRFVALHADLDEIAAV